MTRAAQARSVTAAAGLLGRAAAAALLLVLAPASAAAQPQDAGRFQRPPDPISSLLAMPAEPLIVVSPRRDSIALLERPGAPPIAELAAPELGLAGQTIDPANNGPARVSAYAGVAFIDLASGAVRKAVLPEKARVIAPLWSPNGAHLAFLILKEEEVELWIASVSSGQARRVAGRLNAAFPRAFQWLPDSDGFIVRQIVNGRGPPPVSLRTAMGPVVQESRSGVAAPLQTLQNLLQNPVDEALFEYYFTSVPARVGLDGRPPQPLGTPGLILDHRPSPDGRHILQTRLKRPFSYSVSASSFPTEITVTDREGTVLRRLADLPVQELRPGSVPAGPRSFRWREDAAATLVWAEARNGGDRLLMLDTPFTQAPVQLLELPNRFSRIFWARDDFALVFSSAAAERREYRTAIDPSQPGQGRLLQTRSFTDRSAAAGEPLMRTDRQGRELLHLTRDGRQMFVGGGREVFRLDLQTGETERHWSAAGDMETSLVALLDEAGDRLLIWRESRTAPPNLFVADCSDANARQITTFRDPAPELAAIQQHALRYMRSDGVPLSATLFLPAGFQPGRDKPLPLLIWAYPNAVASPEAVRGGGSNRFVRPHGFDDLELLMLTQGYAVMRAAMPVVAAGGPTTIQGHVPQLVANAEAAVDAAAGFGGIDRRRVAIGGHSYGASMAANLLAHSDLFRAGVALSGAYNRTLTPFGFQTERRTFWEARDDYMEMSPFTYADRINEPILLVHGEADPNSGTLPIQSERFYAALKGAGASARYVLLPHEGHVYRARESLEHLMWEMTRWLDRHLAAPDLPPPPDPTTGGPGPR